jgi:choline dehydrogenase
MMGGDELDAGSGGARLDYARDLIRQSLALDFRPAGKGTTGAGAGAGLAGSGRWNVMVAGGRAGMIGGSHLMLLSGIWPAGRLRDHGVEPVADAPAVANGLRGHPCT